MAAQERGGAARGGPRAGMPREEAVPLLVQREAGRIYSLGLRFCGDAVDAEDLVQETFLAAWRWWGGFEGRADPSTWLYRIAARACQRMHRRRSGQPAELESLDEELPFGEERVAVVPADDGTPLDRELEREARDRVAAAIASLEPEWRLPLVLKEVLGFGVGDVASVLGLPEGTVKSRLHRARLAVRQVLEEVLPSRELPPPAFDRLVCLDLLHAKQEALDRGVPFPGEEGLVCERCREVFRTIDFAVDLCHALGSDDTPLPDEVRERLAVAFHGADPGGGLLAGEEPPPS